MATTAIEEHFTIAALNPLPGIEQVQDEIKQTIEPVLSDIFAVNNDVSRTEILASSHMLMTSQIHDNPELAWEEHRAHNTLCSFLESHSFQPTRRAYGFDTSFECRTTIGKGGRTINFNAEYDALPGIGHGCGHNLISTASLVAYLALSHLMKSYTVEGTIQLLGTPAEELGGGKIELLKAGAYKGVDVSLMAHPFPVANDGSVLYPGGSAGVRLNAKQGLDATFTGKSAHAGGEPWLGINALDALVSAYNNVSMLRQQMHPSYRVHSAIIEAPKVANIIPQRTKAAYSIRAVTLGEAVALTNKVETCIQAGALATGCSCSIDREEPYAELRLIQSLCETYTLHMKSFGKEVEMMAQEVLGGSTDQGNVSQEMPSLHPMFGVSCKPGINIHSADFAEVAGTKGAFDMAVVVGKALALIGWNLLTQKELFLKVQQEFAAE